MKIYTHPQVTVTTIQTKDGALYTKRWLFFKSNLSLEIDLNSHKLWTKKIGVVKKEGSTKTKK